MSDDRAIINQILERAKSNEYMTALEDFLIAYSKIEHLDKISVDNFRITNTKWTIDIILSSKGYICYRLNNREMFLMEAVDYATKTEL